MHNIILQQHASTQSEARNHPKIDLFNRPHKHQKPQISSIPGVCPKERNRYQVKVGEEVIGTDLTLDQALELAKLNGKRFIVKGGEA